MPSIITSWRHPLLHCQFAGRIHSAVANHRGNEPFDRGGIAAFTEKRAQSGIYAWPLPYLVEQPYTTDRLRSHELKRGAINVLKHLKEAADATHEHSENVGVELVCSAKAMDDADLRDTGLRVAVLVNSWRYLVPLFLSTHHKTTR